jgi:hypothetical protein
VEYQFIIYEWMDIVDVICGRCVVPGMSGSHVKNWNTAVCSVLQSCGCCRLFPVFVSVPVRSCMSHFVLCHSCTRVMHVRQQLLTW